MPLFGTMRRNRRDSETCCLLCIEDGRHEHFGDDGQKVENCPHCSNEKRKDELLASGEISFTLEERVRSSLVQSIRVFFGSNDRLFRMPRRAATSGSVAGPNYDHIMLSHDQLRALDRPFSEDFQKQLSELFQANREAEEEMRLRSRSEGRIHDSPESREGV